MILRQRAYKTKLSLNNHERSYFVACAGVARFTFNWGLAEWKRQYEAGNNKPSAYALKKQFNAIKGEQFPWIYDYPYVIVQEAFDHLGLAFKNFFARMRKGEKPGYPRFKSRHKSTPTFTLRGSITVEVDRIRLPIIGWVRLAELGYLPTAGVKILSVTISERAGDWYVSLQVEEEVPDPQSATGEPVGVDLGIKSLAVTSDGATFDNPKTLAKYEKRLARLNRELHRRKKGSKNRAKTKAKIAKLHRKIADTRKHTLHNISRHVTAKTRPKTVVVEDLNVKGMVQNRRLAKAISDAAFGELRRQIEYKSQWNGVEVMVADRFYPSSKTCNGCGYVNSELTLDDREWTCESCGRVVDRDLNAAKNLARLAQ